jgi:hypothetical protein
VCEAKTDGFFYDIDQRLAQVWISSVGPRGSHAESKLAGTKTWLLLSLMRGHNRAYLGNLSPIDHDGRHLGELVGHGAGTLAGACRHARAEVKSRLAF